MPDATQGDIFAALYAAHLTADYWLQTPAQGYGKGGDGAAGRQACARHVATMTAAKAAALGVLASSGRRISWKRAAVALAADAASHYWADRRTPLQGLAELLGRTVVPGKGEFWPIGSPRPGHDDNPCLGTGAHYLDQAWHVTWLWAASVITAGRPR